MTHVVNLTVPTNAPGFTASVVDFPLYIDAADLFTIPTFDTGVSADGGNIRTYKNDGTTAAPREVVDIDTSANTGEIHTLQDLSILSNNVIPIHVVDGATEPAVTDPLGRNAVWPDYEIALHGKDNVDSTGNYGTLTETGSPTKPSGVIGNGFQFASASDYLSTASSDILDDETRTISFWYKRSGSLPSGGDGIAVGVARNTGATPSWGAVLTSSGGNLEVGHFDRLNSINPETGVLSFTVADGEDVFLSYGVSASATEIAAIHNSTTYTGTASGRFRPAGGTTTNRISLNRAEDSSPETGTNLLLDEVRVTASGVSRSTNWRDTEYANQSSPSTFYTVTAVGGGSPSDPVMRLLQSSSWIQGVPYILSSGSWAKAVPYALISGSWAQPNDTT